MSSPQEWTPRVRRVNQEPGDDRIQHIASLIREEQFDEAREELLAILAKDEKSAQARLMLGAVYLRQQQFPEALEQFKEGIAIDPLIAQVHVLGGNCCLRMGDLEQAREMLDTALGLDPKQVNAHVGMAQVLSQTDDPELAIRHLEEALRLDPQLQSARMLMAKLLGQTGQIDAAIEELTTLVHTNPEHTGASLQLAMMKRQKGDNAEAVELLEGVARENPENSRVWDLLGRMKMVMQDYEGAEKAFQEAIALKTTDRATPLRLIDTLIRQGKLEEAREKLQNVPRRGRMKSIVHRFYGDIYAAKELYDEAVESYRAAIIHMPDGEAVIAEIDRAAGAGARSEQKLPHFRAAFARLRDERRKNQGEMPPGAGRGDSARPPQSLPQPERRVLSLRVLDDDVSDISSEI